MKRRTIPDIIGRQNIIHAWHAADKCYRWHARLGGVLVFLGRTETEVFATLDTLARLATLCRNRWRGVVGLSLEGE